MILNVFAVFHAKKLYFLTYIQISVYYSYFVLFFSKEIYFEFKYTFYLIYNIHILFFMLVFLCVSRMQKFINICNFSKKQSSCIKTYKALISSTMDQHGESFLLHFMISNEGIDMNYICYLCLIKFLYAYLFEHDFDFCLTFLLLLS